MFVKKMLSGLNAGQSIWAYLLGLLCGSFVLFGFCPFACAVYICFALTGDGEYAAAAGALSGILLHGAYTSIPPLLLCVAINTVWRIWQGRKLGIFDRMLMLCICGLCEIFTHHSDLRECILTVIMCIVSLLAMLILYNGTSTITRCIRKTRLTTDSEIFYLAVFTAFIILLLSSFAVSKISAASIFAGIVIMLCALLPSPKGIYLATAAATGAGFIYTSNSYSVTTAGALTVICVLCSLVRGRGKAAVAAAYITANILCAIIFPHTVRPTDALISAAFFLCIPAGFTDRAAAFFTERRASAHRQTDALAKVTEGMSAALGAGEIAGDRNFAIRQFGAVSELLGSMRVQSQKSPHIRIEVGMACIPKEGYAHTGDSVGQADFMQYSIVAVSDGMGSGLLAHNESSAAIESFLDMQRAGFSANDCIDYANRQLLTRTKGDFYATLDAIIIDRTSGFAKTVKAGSPASFLLRNGKVRSYCGESLPLGIIENVSAATQALQLSEGDFFILLTDGVHDALKSELIACIAENVNADMNAKYAANRLLDAASCAGAHDDMSVVCIKVISLSKDSLHKNQ